MKKKVYLFCGVESTGKTVAVENTYNYLTKKGYKVKIVSEVGRDVCASSGGVDQMSLLDYERILYLHQSNFLKEYSNDNNEIILLDTDSIYTRYYLEKDLELQKTDTNLSQKLIELSKHITKTNIHCKRINEIIYLNTDCPFVQDGTRTYEQTRKEDDKILFNMYNSIYGNDYSINIIDGTNYNERTNKILEIIDKKN